MFLCQVLFYILFYFILFYFILFYFILFYDYGCTALLNTIIQGLLNKSVSEGAGNSVQSSFFRPSPLLT